MVDEQTNDSGAFHEFSPPPKTAELKLNFSQKEIDEEIERQKSINPEQLAIQVLTLKAKNEASEEREEKLKQQAVEDELTGLRNRKGWQNYIEKYIPHAKRKGELISVAVIDLNGLNAVNNNLGHIEGDKVLKLTATILTSTLRTSDVLARVGGDEFYILLPDMDGDNANVLLDRVKTQLIEQMDLKKDDGAPVYDVPLSFSIGVSQMQEDELTLDTAIRRADKEMYADKAKEKATESKKIGI